MSTSDWSVPETEVLAAAREALDAGRPAVLATIVDVHGSAYRRPGAKMVVPAEGGGVGSITAGCLEDEVLALAADVLEEGRPRVETFDLTGEEDVWGLGVGCNGVIDILLEPLDADYRPTLDAVESGTNVAVCTVLESDRSEIELGDRVYVAPDAGDGGVSSGNGGDGADDAFDPASGVWPTWLADELREPAARLAADGQSRTLAVGGEVGSATAFVDGLAAPPELVVCGTGHDVGPVVELAKQADFRVTVVGFRGASATADRFPAANAVRSTSPGDLREAYDFDADTYAVVMTHNFVDDRLAVDELLRTPVPYVGLMGPRERFGEMREAFTEEGREFAGSELDRLYTPAGLDLGGETPYAIAHSIVAELLAVHNDRTPRHLREREGRIHERVAVSADGGERADGARASSDARSESDGGAATGENDAGDAAAPSHNG
jgi:xanthine dehydrogenase accessory factor